MRVAALTADHHFEVVTVDDPTPGPDELVVAVGACGICGSDLKSYSALPAGSVLGHEFCGEVVAAGTRARETWREGQFVAAMPVRACGRCRWCLADEPAHCERADLLGVGGAAGAFAELVRVDANLAVALPTSVGDVGAAVEPLAVGLHAAVTAGIRPGDRVLVLGGGSVGTAVTVWARRLGAVEVVVSDPAAPRRAGAAAVGAAAAPPPPAGAPPPGGARV
ncbi:alcohol dehydrogenase catalytic domain-containing protein, partial [Frankia sp. CNm7]|uniref:zinc-dependent alcohol dehydrogenase n=1 Tax=Frankia nepalensis TaxID=1836974 RepID=UPI0019339068